MPGARLAQDVKFPIMNLRKTVRYRITRPVILISMAILVGGSASVETAVDPPNIVFVLSNTLFVLTSDNGFLLGEHRVRSKKRLAYEAAQPGLWIAGPGFPAGVTSDAFATNLDLVPTLVKASFGAIPWMKLDGRALQDVLLEQDLGHDRFLPIHVPIETVDVGKQPTADAVRTWRYKYVQYADGSESYTTFLPTRLNGATKRTLEEITSRSRLRCGLCCPRRRLAKPVLAARALHLHCKSRAS